MSIPTIELPTGARMPQLGFGTYKVTENVELLIETALELGYRHIDTAQMYGNEAAIGRALTDSGIRRDELFITSKLDNPNHLRPEAESSFEATLTDLQTDYVDLFLIHWPLPHQYGGDFVSTWRILEEFHADGRALAIGVSNFEPDHLQRLVDAGCSIPAVNQVESHPYLPNRAIHARDAELGIVTEAWSPLARGKVVSDPVLTEIGIAHGKTAAQVALRWSVQRGDAVFPKASSRRRMAENATIFDFRLTVEEMGRIDALDRGEAGHSGSRRN